MTRSALSRWFFACATTRFADTTAPGPRTVFPLPQKVLLLTFAAAAWLAHPFARFWRRVGDLETNLPVGNAGLPPGGFRAVPTALCHQTHFTQHFLVAPPLGHAGLFSPRPLARTRLHWRRVRRLDDSRLPEHTRPPDFRITRFLDCLTPNNFCPACGTGWLRRCVWARFAGRLPDRRWCGRL